jgi:hypothetical protein
LRGTRPCTMSATEMLCAVTDYPRPHATLVPYCSVTAHKDNGLDVLPPRPWWPRRYCNPSENAARFRLLDAFNTTKLQSHDPFGAKIYRLPPAWASQIAAANTTYTFNGVCNSPRHMKLTLNSAVRYYKQVKSGCLGLLHTIGAEDLKSAEACQGLCDRTSGCETVAINQRLRKCLLRSQCDTTADIGECDPNREWCVFRAGRARSPMLELWLQNSRSEPGWLVGEMAYITREHHVGMPRCGRTRSKNITLGKRQFSCNRPLAQKQYQKRHRRRASGQICQRQLRLLQDTESAGSATMERFYDRVRAKSLPLRIYTQTDGLPRLVGAKQIGLLQKKPIIDLTELVFLRIRYFSLLQLPSSDFSAGTPFANASILLFARASKSKATGYFQSLTLLLGADASAQDGMASEIRMWPTPIIRLANDVSHNFGATLVPTANGSTPRLLGVGGQMPPFGSKSMRSATERNDGIYAFRAGSLAEVVDGAFFPFNGSSDAGVWGHYRRTGWSSQQQRAATHLVDGMHSSCVECRRTNRGLCEFDGKFSVVYFRGRYMLYARANTNQKRGGRFVQVTRSAADNPTGDWGPFQMLQIAGYTAADQKNIYFAAINRNPFDPRTLIGLFPVASSVWQRANGSVPRKEPYGFIGMSLSCDGVHWGPLISVLTSAQKYNRTRDQPVDGLIVFKDHLFVLVHQKVPDIGAGGSPSLRPLLMPRAKLVKLAQAAHESLPGCDGAGAFANVTKLPVGHV